MIDIGCNQCGACCRNIPEQMFDLFDLPRTDKKGVCGHLKEDNTCAIFENRPNICRSDRIYEDYFKKEGMSEKQFIQNSQQACDTLREMERKK